MTPTQVIWIQTGLDLLQTIIGGVFVALIIFWLDERRAKRDRRLSDFRIAANWEVTEPKPSLRNFDLMGTNLSGYNLAGVNLESANLRKTALWGTKLNRSNLRKANFLGASFAGVNLKGAVAYYANFSKSSLRKERTSEAPLQTDFSEAVLRGCSFRKANIEEVLFNYAFLTRADFSGSTVIGCDFTGADLTDSKWTKVRLVEKCTWENVKGVSAVNFPPELWKEIQKQNE